MSQLRHRGARAAQEPQSPAQRKAGAADSSGLRKAVRRPRAWKPPPGAALSRNQIFRYRRCAVEQYAEYLGFDLRLDGELLWLAEEGLYAGLSFLFLPSLPLCFPFLLCRDTLKWACTAVPEGYKEMHDLHGTPYYYHLASRTVSWEHPLDAEYRDKLRGMRTIHDLADPGIGKVRTWLKEQADGSGGGQAQVSRSKRSLLRRAMQVVTGSILLAALLGSAAYVALEVWRVRQLMFMPGPILAQVAGALGSAEAAVEAGLVFYNGEGGISSNTTQALAWFLLAGDLGDARGLRMAATILFKGERGVAKDVARAAELFHEAALKRDAFSLSYYGLIHYQGSGEQRPAPRRVPAVLREGCEAAAHLALSMIHDAI
jgi:hypothetical protein